MKKIIAFTFVLLSSTLVFAQQGRITKAQGNRALVTFPQGTVLSNGAVISLGSGGGSFGASSAQSGGGSGAMGPRDKIIGLSASLLSGSTSGGTGGSSSSATSASVSFLYGWNSVTMEYGPRASVRFVTPGNSTSFGLGGFFDYNFVPNVPGQTVVYGLGATLDFASTSGGGASSTTTTALFAGGNLKWFPLGNSVSIRTDAGIGYVPGSGTSGASTTFGLLCALLVYF